MQTVTDAQMHEMLAKTKPYTMILLRDGPNWHSADRDKIVWEHGRRNFSLRLEGLLAIVSPVLDDSGIRGLGIFTVDQEETSRILDGDPGVQAGVFVYEVHPIQSFPGDFLPP